jgi:hypothetical protein
LSALYASLQTAILVSHLCIPVMRWSFASHSFFYPFAFYFCDGPLCSPPSPSTTAFFFYFACVSSTFCFFFSACSFLCFYAFSVRALLVLHLRTLFGFTLSSSRMYQSLCRSADLVFSFFFTFFFLSKLSSLLLPWLDVLLNHYYYY